MPFQLVVPIAEQESSESSLQESLSFTGLEEAFAAESVIAVQARLVVNQPEGRSMGG